MKSDKSASIDLYALLGITNGATKEEIVKFA
jgi:hypothetical protein